MFQKKIQGSFQGASLKIREGSHVWTGFVAECATFYKYWINHYPVCICLAVSKYGNFSCNETMGICSTVRVRLKNFSTKQKFEHVH